MKKFFLSIRIEEYLFFIICSLIVFLNLIFSYFGLADFSLALFFKKEIDNLIGIYEFFYPLIFFIILIVTMRLISRLRNYLEKNILCKQKTDKEKSKIKIKTVFFIMRNFVGFLIFFIFSVTSLGFLNDYLNSRTINNELIELDKTIFFGYYPFIWFQNINSVFHFFDYLISYSFGSITIFLCLAMIILYIYAPRKLFAQYIMAITLAVTISTPLWIIFPSNSPYNAFIGNVKNEEINPVLEKELENYNPPKVTEKYQTLIGKKQKNHPPITTMPSMHVAFAIIISYMIWRVNRKLSYFIMIWAFFSTIGTIYLAQHYFIDILVAVPIAELAFLLGGKLANLEGAYYKLNKSDIAEAEAKIIMKNDLKYFILPIRIGYDFFKSEGLGIFKKLKLALYPQQLE